MKDEIKEISKADKKLLDKIEYILGSELSSKEYDVFYNYFNEIRKPNILIDIKDDENIKDCITNLQEELKEYKMLFDAFSERPYAHRYLEEKKKELGNKNIIGLDSEMIYKDYYDLKEENKQTKLLKEKYQLEKEVYKLKNEKAIEYIKSYKNDYAPYELSDYNIRELLNILNGGDEEC